MLITEQRCWFLTLGKQYLPEYQLWNHLPYFCLKNTILEIKKILHLCFQQMLDRIKLWIVFLGDLYNSSLFSFHSISSPLLSGLWCYLPRAHRKEHLLVEGHWAYYLTKEIIWERKGEVFFLVLFIFKWEQNMVSIPIVSISCKVGSSSLLCNESAELLWDLTWVPAPHSEASSWRPSS